MNASPEAKFSEQSVLWVKQHTSKLITFAIDRPEHYRFSAGQFSRLGFRDGNGFIWRAYSILSAEYADTLEYFAVLIPDGPMSLRLSQLKANDTILLDKTATGFFLPQRFVEGTELIMLATGSGIAPFLSILQQPETWLRFQHLILIHSVSYANELIFTPTIHALAEHPLVGEYYQQLIYQPVITREQVAGALSSRLPKLITAHELEHQLSRQFSPEKSRFMICGNPQMVQETFAALLQRGFSMHRNRIPGQIIMENGF